ncbi:Ig-like protein group 1 [Psychrobacter immobilis]|uniref:Ig-like protein group 1 n=1 Tax=Psychrobacter immobilis TaxID=498 RepID=A0A2V2A0P5_PSYIM|nr:Ig-like domain-containing protein [Psychrobacter immobilis]PWK15438.1 Ig-like protein group 1 [Psychrobacter immobilis]
MSYSSLPFTSKLFQLTSLTCALALAGCGGGGDGDTVDSVAPAPDLGVTQPGTGGNGNTGGGEQVPDVEPDFFIQKLSTAPTIIELSDEQAAFSVAVKAVEKVSGGAMVGKAVTLKVVDSENNGITIEGQSTQTTDNDGNAVYALKLNPQAVADKDDLIKNGFTLVATAKKADGTAVAPQELKVSVSKKGSGDGTQVIESELDISTSLTTSSVSNNVLNVYGDTATLSVIAKNSKGARVKDVAVGLGIANVKGIAIVGGSTKVTDDNGLATFTIQVDDKLSVADRTALVGKAIAYAINIAEESGATKETKGEFKAALPVSDYALTVTGSSSRLSAYGDSQTITIAATAKNSKVPTAISGSTATIKLNDGLTGVNLSTNKVTLNAQGQANVTLNIDAAVSEADRKTLIKNGISYTVVLTEPNRSSTSKTASSIVYLPTAEYKINFNESNKKELSSSGGSAVISFRVNNSRGGIIAGQKVTASLPKDLANAGLLTLQNNSEQVTDSKGEVSYTVRVPNNLTEAQKLQLEKATTFALTASIIESSGVPSSVSSEKIRIGSDIGQSDIQLSAQSLPTTVSALAEQFKLQVSGKRKNGSAAVGRTVKVVLDQSTSTGITIIGNELITDNSGIAEFSIGISKSLTPTQRENLIKSGIGYTAVITDEDGTQSRLPGNIKVEQPVTSIQFASIATPSISELGGNGNISVKLTTKGSNVKPVSDKEITIQLGAKALSYGVTVTQSAMTDFNGDALFAVNIPSDLTAAERTDLKNTGINYQLSYVENGIVYNSAATKVTIITPVVTLNILNATNNINSQAGYILNNVGSNASIQAQLNDQSSGEQIASQPVKLTFSNKQLASLLTVNGQIGSSTITASTNENGLVSFNVVVSNDLTAEQKAALSTEVLTATLTETLTGKKQQVNVKVQSIASAISLLVNSSKALNLNGGETQIEVVAKDKKGNVVTGQKVFFALPASVASKGVILVSDSQTTDNSGKAVFTIAVANNLTESQKSAIGSSISIALSAADVNGNIVTQAANVTTVTPDVNGTKENLTIGANKVVNTKGDTFKVFVRLENEDGAVANREVSLNVDDPLRTGVSVSNGTANTNSDGVATFNLTLESGANVNQAILADGIRLTATTTTAENVKLEQNYIVAVDTATIDSYQLIASSDKPTLNTGGDQTNATFRVTDSKGGILAGVPVQLNIEALEASGAALTTPSMVTTDANGQIDIGVILAANSINSRLNHSVVINAKIVTPQYDADGKVSMQVREEKSLSLSAIGTEITITATDANLKDGASTTITTTLVDGAGRAIANADMELVDANGDIIHSSATATSNVDGKAVFNINEADLNFDNNGNLRIFARATGERALVAQRSTSSLDLVKVSQAGISFINIEDVYDVNAAQNINVQIRTDSPAQATALIGKVVEVQTTIGTFANNNVIVTQAITAGNIQGNIITVPVVLTSTLAGTTVLQATVLGEMTNGALKYQTTVDTRFRATTPAKMLFQAVKSVITPGSSTEVVATVKDKNDVPVEGQTVVFSRAADSSAGRLSAATAVTNSKGEARVVYQANASSPIGGVIINARLLNDNASIGTKTTNITVSKEAVYTTLAFSNVLSTDNIYYTVRGSISVMDGSGRAVPNKEVSIKSYAIEYAQGKVCLLDSNVTYQAANTTDADGNVNTPEPITFAELVPVLQKTDWIISEDSPEYNYTLDSDEDVNSNNSLDAINPVAIIGGTLSDDGYSFVTDEEGRADFEIRYPIRYSSWVKVRFEASTFLNGSENTQSINYSLPYLASDLRVEDPNLFSPWIGDTSPFGDAGVVCVNSLSVNINAEKNTSKIVLSPYQASYSVSINGVSPTTTAQGYNSFIVDFNQAFDLGSTIGVNSNGSGFSRNITIE